MSVFVVIDVGCLECGLDTELAGVFPDRSDAEAWVAEHETVGTDQALYIFEVEVPT
jgi:hypothetical protein